MNRFDDTASSCKSALESTETFSPKLIDEAMKIHTSSDLKATESQIASLDTDALALGIAISIDMNWNSARGGSVKAAAELQQFVERAALSRDDEILPKVYQALDPYIAKQLKIAVENHRVIEFD